MKTDRFSDKATPTSRERAMAKELYQSHATGYFTKKCDRITATIFIACFFIIWVTFGHLTGPSAFERHILLALPVSIVLILIIACVWYHYTAIEVQQVDCFTLSVRLGETPRTIDLREYSTVKIIERFWIAEATLYYLSGAKRFFFFTYMESPLFKDPPDATRQLIAFLETQYHSHRTKE